jgi:hypothetical protein
MTTVSAGRIPFPAKVEILDTAGNVLTKYHEFGNLE